MLDIHVTIEGQKVVIDGLQRYGTRINSAVRRALETIGKGVFNEAYYWLNGAGALYIQRFSRKTGEFRRQKFVTTAAGGYPVPVRTGHLRRMLDWLKPGETKSAGSKTFTAFLNETVVYDSADYAETIFQGKGTSAKYGPRDALKDGLERFNRGGKIRDIIEEEIKKERGGLG